MKHSVTKADINVLETFVPVEGTWTSFRDHNQITKDISESICGICGFPVNVQLFRENGCSLQGDERSGTMIVTRA